MGEKALAVNYCLLVESNPDDSSSDLLGVRRAYMAPTYPTPHEPGTGEWTTFVDTIPRAGNSRGKVILSVVYEGRTALDEIDLGANPLAGWLAAAEGKHGGPIDLNNL